MCLVRRSFCSPTRLACRTTRRTQGRACTWTEARPLGTCCLQREALGCQTHSDATPSHPILYAARTCTVHRSWPSIVVRRTVTFLCYAQPAWLATRSPLSIRAAPSALAIAPPAPSARVALSLRRHALWALTVSSRRQRPCCVHVARTALAKG